MEKIKKAQPPKNRESDFILRIIAVVIAVIIWVILSITQYPTTTIQVSNVPVVFSLEGTNAKSKGLSPVNLPDNLTVNVEIKGMKYEIGGYTEKDLNATVNLDPVNNEGTYSLDIDVESTHSSDQCTIVSVSPATIDVSFEKINSKSFDLSAQAPYVEADEGYTLKKTDVSPSEIEIQGTEKDLEKIAKISAKVNDSMIISENTTVSTSDLVFYDKNNKDISSVKYTVLNNKNFDVSFSVYKQKDAKLKINFSNCPDGFDASSIPYVLSQDTVKIISPVLNSETTIEKSIGTISLNEIDLDKSFKFKLKLNEGEEIVGDSDDITVSFNKSGYTSRKYNITSDKFRIINRPAGMKVSIVTKALQDVTIIGPESVINNISSDDLVAVINLNGVTKSGNIKTYLDVYSPEYNNVWCYGKNEAEIVIS